jgi:hypothetical protein
MLRKKPPPQRPSRKTYSHQNKGAMGSGQSLQRQHFGADAKDPVQAHQSGVSSMVGPSEFADMKWNVLEAKIIDQSSEPSHYSPIIVVVVLNLRFINQVEVTCYDP